MRVATWNLEQASGSRPAQMQIERLGSLDRLPDIIVLTETCEKVDLSDLGYVVCYPRRKNKYGKYWSAAWSRYPITRELETYDQETAVCVELAAPGGKIVVYGTILTWRNDRGPDPANPSPPWFEHHKAIKEHGDDWLRLIGEIEDAPFIVWRRFQPDSGRLQCILLRKERERTTA